MRQLILKPKKDHFVKRMHPWIFSGAIINAEEVEDGELVEVLNAKHEFLALGHYQEGSIAVRILTYQKEEIGKSFWVRILKNAIEHRKQIELPNTQTNCYRLIHGAGDGAPGLVIDIFSDVAVVQCHSIGMHKMIYLISNALTELIPDMKAIYCKSKTSLPTRYALSISDGFVRGNAENLIVKENGLRFLIDFEDGQKTGFYLDQRDNRKLLSKYVAGKKVLNAFCYSGGFSVYALAAGAHSVDSIDLSASAIELTDKNIEINQFKSEHKSIKGDVIEFLKSCDQYEVMIIDPPAFAKKPSKRHNAVQGYKRLNALAIKKVTVGGVLFTFSCSQVIDRQLFYDTIVAAAIEVGRKVKVLHHLSQPADHPVNLFHPEGSYLKGLVLRIED